MPLACPCGSRMKVEKIGVVYIDRSDDGHPLGIYSGDLVVCTTCPMAVITLADFPWYSGNVKDIQYKIERLQQNPKLVIYGA